MPYLSTAPFFVYYVEISINFFKKNYIQNAQQKFALIAYILKWQREKVLPFPIAKKNINI